jgi:hypothetical protein
MYRSGLTVLTIAAALLVALLAVPALGQAPDTVTLLSASPANGATVPPAPSGGIPWDVRISGPPTDANVAVTITDSPATDPDGVTVSNINRVDFFFLQQDDANLAHYTGKSDPGPNAWSENVGGYYWQVRATWTDAAGTFHAAVSPIQRLGVGAPAPPAPGGGTGGGTNGGGGGATTRTTLAMSATDATFYVRAAIRQRTKRKPVGLSYRCAKVKSSSWRCRPTWHDSRSVYSGTVTFTHSRSGSRIVAKGTFAGTRASRTCLRTRSRAACTQRFRWSITTASRPLGTT